MNNKRLSHWLLRLGQWFSLPLLSLIIYGFYGAQFQDEEFPGHPCNRPNYQASCYGVAKEACYSLWNQLEASCRSEVKTLMDPKKLTALIGPAVHRCAMEKFDKSFKFNRKTYSSSESCSHFFTAIDSRPSW